MIRWLLPLILSFLGVLGCQSYSGGARATDPAQLVTQRGWIVAGATPQLEQEGSHDCGAAALAMVAGRWQLQMSVSEALAALPSPRGRGARLGDLRDVARKHGLSAFAIAGDRETLMHELRAGRPVIVGLLLPTSKGQALSHYEVLVATHPDDARFVTIDPARGWRSRSWADFDAEWGRVGRPTLVIIGIESIGKPSVSQRVPSPKQLEVSLL